MHPYLCSDGDAIGHILLFIPEYEAEHFGAVYTALIGSMAVQCKFILIAEPEAMDHINQWSISESCSNTLTIINAGNLKLTAWARDPALAVRVDDGIGLMVSKALDRRNDLAALKLLAHQDGFLLSDASVSFEGGNILFGEDHVFVGADMAGAMDGSAVVDELFPTQCEKIIIGCNKPPPAQITRTAMAEDEQWQEIFHYHNKPGTCQPVFHIDMFISLAGKDKYGRQIILVGDPSLAAETLDMVLHPLALSAYFDEIANDLMARGFVVIRNPLPMIYMDDVEKCTRTWFYASSNNVLVQQSETDGHIVWMSEFGHDNWPGLRKTDAANRDIWENLGFEVRMILDGQRLAENLGGLHCLTNVLKRG